jgi:signal peptidase complex subunit 2
LKIKTDENEQQENVVVDKWDWNAVKNALDDSARKFLVNQNGVKEDNTLMNGRLAISTIAVLFSIYAIAYDWFHPFPESKQILIICVVAYFITVCILTLYTSFLEKGCFVAARHIAEPKNVWKISSRQDS